MTPRPLTLRRRAALVGAFCAAVGMTAQAAKFAVPDPRPTVSYQTDQMALAYSPDWIAFGASFVGMGIDPAAFESASGSRLFNWGIPNTGTAYRQRVLQAVRAYPDLDGVILEIRPGALDPMPADRKLSAPSVTMRTARGFMEWLSVGRIDRSIGCVSSAWKGLLPIGRLLLDNSPAPPELHVRRDGFLTAFPGDEPLSRYKFTRGFEDVPTGKRSARIELQQLLALKRTLEGMGIKVAFVRMPEGPRYANEAEAVDALAAIDLNDRDRFPELFEWENRYDNTHLNPEGAKIAGAAIGARVARSLASL